VSPLLYGCIGEPAALRRRVALTPVSRGAGLAATRARSPRPPPRDAFSRRRKRLSPRLNLESDDAREEAPRSATWYLSTARACTRPLRASENKTGRAPPSRRDTSLFVGAPRATREVASKSHETRRQEEEHQPRRCFPGKLSKRKNALATVCLWSKSPSSGSPEGMPEAAGFGNRKVPVYRRSNPHRRARQARGALNLSRSRVGTTPA
jgi:hypothetical protein